MTFDHAYILDVVPKTSYNDTEKSYFVSVTVCLHVVSEPSKPLQVNIAATTNTSREEFDVTGVRQTAKEASIMSRDKS